jgi:Ca2+-binding EF-hand superfamily protein
LRVPDEDELVNCLRE